MVLRNSYKSQILYLVLEKVVQEKLNVLSLISGSGNYSLVILLWQIQ